MYIIFIAHLICIRYTHICVCIYVLNTYMCVCVSIYIYTPTLITLHHNYLYIKLPHIILARNLRIWVKDYFFFPLCPRFQHRVESSGSAVCNLSPSNRKAFCAGDAIPGRGCRREVVWKGGEVKAVDAASFHPSPVSAYKSDIA